ncbi:MAG: HlyD family efflux transporter periplasmic adaptor subunit, partial [Williamsia herbipolensis]|nr:HlyD family efflux transporter periplasmic adaptor subunit [Williamsia herbipolensis]
QRALDTALTAQDRAVAALTTACASSQESTPTSATVTADDDGTVTGQAGSAPASVTLRSSSGDLAETSSTNPQQVAGGGTWRFAGLTAGMSYRVQIVRTAVVSTDDCQAAIADVTSGQRAVTRAAGSLDDAIDKLTKSIAANGSSGGASGQPSVGSSSAPSGQPSSAPSGGSTRSAAPTTGSGSSGTRSTPSNGSTGELVTAERIAADTKNVDAKRAALAVAKQAASRADLTATISGTVAAVDVAKGDSVGTSDAAVTVVGHDALSVTVDIAIGDIDSVEVGQTAAIDVDGRTESVPAHVTYIGATNSASSSGSSATYPVTVTLDEKYASLYDGMGAAVAIHVGTAKKVLTVPLSAVRTTARADSVQVRNENGTVSTTQVTTGLVGEDRVQIKSGLTAGQQVVLAELSVAVPSSDSDTNRRGGTGLTGLTGGSGAGVPAGGPPGGR